MPANVRWSRGWVRQFGLVTQFVLLANGPVGCGARTQLGTDERRRGCEPALKSEEVCNGVDDDCDGLVDEDLELGSLAGPIILRDDEGSAGECSTCKRASSPRLWASDDGLIAFWKLNSDGANPRPNIYARRLTPDLAFRGEPFLAVDLTAFAFHVDPSRTDQALVVFCRRFENRDRVFSADFGRDGFTRGELVRRSPADSECRFGMPDVASIWTGRRHLIAWTNSRWPFGAEVDIADESGRSVRQEHLELAGGIPLRMAKGHDQVALITAVAQAPPGATLAFHRFTLDGERLSGPVLFELTEEISSAVLAAVGSGWVIYCRSFNAKPFRLELSIDGNLLRRTELPGEPTFAPDALFSRPGGGFVSVETRLGGEALQRLGWYRSDGDPEWSWLAPSDDPVLDAAVLEHEGRSYLVYARQAPNPEPNQIVLREFGCLDTAAGSNQ